jgi:hypothetical protein
MYSAPVDQTVFQTMVMCLFGWIVYTFLYKPILCEPEPITFTIAEIREIVKVGVDDFYNSMNDLKNEPTTMQHPTVSKQVRYTDEMDAVNALIMLKHPH